MSDNYQAVYDAVRSKMSYIDGSQVIETIRSAFDVSYAIDAIKNEFINTAIAMAEPSVLYRPKLYKDGNKWCALYGEDLQNGVAGFGDSPVLAMSDFNKNWSAKI